MFPDELTFRTMQAALAARQTGFYATADAFLSLARHFAFDALELEYRFAGSSCRLCEARKGEGTR